MKHLIRHLLLLAAVLMTLTLSSKAVYAASTSTSDKYMVTVSSLKVHSSAGIAKEVTAHVYKGNIVTVKETKTLGGGATWARITCGKTAGWVNMKFLTNATGWTKDNGTWKYYKDGVLKFTSNAMHTANKKIEGKTSGTKYYLVIDRSNYRVFAFQKINGTWTPVRSMVCGVGKAATPTPAGTFTIFSRWDILKSSNSWEYYPVEFLSNNQGTYCFHSVLYYKGTSLKNVKNAKVKDGTVGAAISHGCVRLKLASAQWIYEKCANGTKVLSY